MVWFQHYEKLLNESNVEQIEMMKEYKRVQCSLDEAEKELEKMKNTKNINGFCPKLHFSRHAGSMVDVVLAK